jgi:hypothetical protein
VLPRPQIPWGDLLRARVQNDRLVVIAGKSDVRRRALVELHQSVSASGRGNKRLIMLGALISHVWSQWEQGAARTLHDVFYNYETVTGEQPEWCEGTAIRALILDTLRASERNQMTGRMKDRYGVELLHRFWTAASELKLYSARDVQDWTFMHEAEEIDDFLVVRAMDFLGLAYTLGVTVGGIYLSFDSLELGTNRQVKTVETVVQQILNQPDFKAFTVVLGWDGEDSTLNRFGSVAPILEDVLIHNSLTVH